MLVNKNSFGTYFFSLINKTFYIKLTIVKTNQSITNNPNETYHNEQQQQFNITITFVTIKETKTSKNKNLINYDLSKVIKTTY